MLVVNQDVKGWFYKFAQKCSLVQQHGGKARHDLMSMALGDQKAAIDFSRYHLTHLDRVLLKPTKLPAELFLCHDELILPILRSLREAKESKILCDSFSGIAAKTLEGTAVFIKSFNPYNQRFLVYDKNSGDERNYRLKSRMYLTLPHETERLG